MKLSSHYAELTEHELQRHIDRRDSQVKRATREIAELKKLIAAKRLRAERMAS